MDLSPIEVDQLEDQYITVGLIYGNSQYTSRLEKDFTKFNSFKQALKSALTYETDILIGPEYDFVPNKPLTIEERDSLLLELRDMSEGHNTLFLPGTYFWEDSGGLVNTLPVYHNGDLVYLYDKVKNGGESISARTYGLTFKPGVLPGVISYKGLDIGLEICADHSSPSVLKQHNISDLDLEIVSSCGMNVRHNRAATHVGAYQLNSDGWYLNTNVQLNQGPGENEFERILPTKAIPLNDNIHLHIYKIDKQSFNPDLHVEEQIPEAYWEHHGGRENVKPELEKA